MELLTKACVEMMRDIPETRAFIDNLTPEKSRELGIRLIQEQVQRQGITELAAINILAPMWLHLYDLAQDIFPKLAEHMTALLKLCD